MKFKSKESLDEKEVQKGLKFVLFDGVTSHLMGVLTGGVFLVAVALQLGASNFQIGLLAAIPPLVQLVQLPAIFIIEKIKSRKTVAVYSVFAGRLIWFIIAAIPFLFISTAALPALITCILISSVLGGVGGCAWNSWMRDLVPEDRMGAFFSRRLQIAIILGIIVSLLASILIDRWQFIFGSQQIFAYSGLFAAGAVIGLVGVFFLAKTPEKQMVIQNVNFFKLIARTFKDLNFRRLMLFLGSWSFAVNLAAPFFTVYMLKRLELGMSLVVALSVVSQICNFTFLGIWGRATDKFSNKSVLAVSCPLFMLSVLAWAFTTLPDKYFLTLPLLVLIHIVMGTAIAGVTIASGNIGLKLAPKGEATAYLAANTLVNSFAAGLGPIIGGKFADFFAFRNLSILLQWTGPVERFTLQTLSFQHWDFFFVFAFLAGFYALHRLSMVKEEGEVDDKIVRAEFIASVKKPLRSLSSGAGLFQLLSYPFTLFLKYKQPKNQR